MREPPVVYKSLHQERQHRKDAHHERDLGGRRQGKSHVLENVVQRIAQDSSQNHGAECPAVQAEVFVTKEKPDEQDGTCEYEAYPCERKRRNRAQGQLGYGKGRSPDERRCYDGRYVGSSACSHCCMMVPLPAVLVKEGDARLHLCCRERKKPRRFVSGAS